MTDIPLFLIKVRVYVILNFFTLVPSAGRRDAENEGLKATGSSFFSSKTYVTQKPLTKKH